MKSGKVCYNHIFENSEKIYGDYDLRIMFEGKVPVVRILSPEANKQFAALNDGIKIDRSIENKGIGKMAAVSLINIRSTPYFEKRRKTILGLLSLNSSSRYIPSMVEWIEKHTVNWKEGISYPWITEMNKLTFAVIVDVLFGKDSNILNKMRVNYEISNGVFEEMLIRDALIQLLKDFIDAWISPITILAPFLNIYNITNPFKRNQRNLNAYKSCLKEVFSKISDKDSICSLYLKAEGINSEDIFEDLHSFMMGGTETSAHLVTTIMYYLK